MFQWIANGQIGHHRDHVRKLVVQEVKNLPDQKRYQKKTEAHALAQIKNLNLAIPKAALVSFHVPLYPFYIYINQLEHTI